MEDDWLDVGERAMSTAVQTDGTDGPARTGSGLAWSRSGSAIRVFLFFAVPVLIGCGLAFLVHDRLVLPRIATGSPDVTRVVEISRKLDAALSPNTAVFVGDSVTVEGVDARVAAGALGVSALNLAVNGGNPTELAVILPKIVKAKPAYVIFTLRPRSLGKPIDLDADKAWAYAWGEYVKAWPGEWVTPEWPGFDHDRFSWVNASVVQAKVHFRTAMMNQLNTKIRAKMRRGIVPMAPDEFAAPAEMRMSLEGRALEAHVLALRKEYEEALREGFEGTVTVERLFALVREGGATPVFVMAPTHPALRATVAEWMQPFADFAAQMGAKYGATVIDASTLLDESGFADGQHPNAAGREKLSTFVGTQLKRGGVR
jgi:hypothetical protein